MTAPEVVERMPDIIIGSWCGKKSQIMFMDRDDILNLFVVTNLPLQTGRYPTRTSLTTKFRFECRSAERCR